MGPPRAGEIIRQGLYRGADTGWLLTDRLFAGADTLATICFSPVDLLHILFPALSFFPSAAPVFSPGAAILLLRDPANSG